VKTEATRPRQDLAYSKSEEAAREAWVRMRELTHDPRVLGLVHTLATEAGLIPGAVKAIPFLSATEPMPMRQLAANLRCDNSYVTTIVDNLEEAGIARRQAHATDRRIKVVVLTEAGHAMAKRVAQIMGTPPPSFGTLETEETIALRDLLRKLTAHAELLA
jgi:DNA-binding MarR family transcriptional regulator